MSGSLDVGIPDSAVAVNRSFGLVATIVATFITVANTAEAMRHDSVECKRVTCVSFCVGKGLLEGVVVVAGFHGDFLSMFRG